MQPSNDRRDRSIGRQLRRYGPLVAIVVVGAVVAGALVLIGDGEDDETGADDQSPVTRPEGAISFAQAEEEGLDVEFGDGCDRETGRVAMPYYFAAECYANVDDNGGPTSTGVTGDAITVALYVGPEQDPVLDFITAAIANDDTNAQVEDTYRGYIELFESYYQTYGRRVDLQVVVGSGDARDEVAARADAQRVVEEIQPFAVWGGPVLTTAWADEMAANGIVCLGCLGGSTPEWYEERAPYVLPITKNGDQNQVHLVEYLEKQLAGRPAEHAGDTALRSQERTFGYLYIETSEESHLLADNLEARLDEAGLELAARVPYTLDPVRLQEQAAGAIARLKDAGVTSVIFNGDPVAPGTFTREATAQGYFPEWVLTGSTLVDTTAFARTYDQQQWANAFGISNLSARMAPERGASFFLYEWFHGEPPPAIDTAGILFPQPALFYAALQAAGPELSPETFRSGLFTGEPTPDAITNPSISFGDHGIWPYTDYNGVDDATEVWWDPETVGPDEIRREAPGMYRYVEGGRRHLPGDWPEVGSRAFELEGTVTIYEEPPPEEAPPDYASPAE